MPARPYDVESAHLPVFAESGTAEFAPDGETARVAREIP
jgi:hypothetical protein